MRDHGGRPKKPRIAHFVRRVSVILGPTLFLLYTNDAEDHLPAGAQLAAYADDTTLYKCISTNTAVPEDVTTLHLAVNALADWGMAWHIRLQSLQSLSLS